MNVYVALGGDRESDTIIGVEFTSEDVRRTCEAKERRYGYVSYEEWTLGGTCQGTWLLTSEKEWIRSL